MKRPHGNLKITPELRARAHAKALREEADAIVAQPRDHSALADVEIRNRITGDSTQIRRNKARIGMVDQGCGALGNAGNTSPSQDSAGAKDALSSPPSLRDACHEALRLLLLNAETEGNTQLLNDAATILSEALASQPKE